MDDAAGRALVGNAYQRTRIPGGLKPMNKVELNPTNFYTGRRSVTGRAIDKAEPMLADIVSGPLAEGFLAREDLQNPEQIPERLREMGRACIADALAFFEAADMPWQVPTWREYRLAELRHTVDEARYYWNELGRNYADRARTFNPFARGALDFLKHEKGEALSRAEILEAFGVNESDIQEESKRIAAERAAQFSEVPF